MLLVTVAPKPKLGMHSLSTGQFHLSDCFLSLCFSAFSKSYSWKRNRSTNCAALARIEWKFNIKPIFVSSWNWTIGLLVLCRRMTRWLIVHLLLFYSVHNPIDHIILMPSYCSCCNMVAGQDSLLAYFRMDSLFPVHICSWFILIENPLNGCRTISLPSPLFLPRSLYPGQILSWCPKEEESHNGRRAILNTL